MDYYKMSKAQAETTVECINTLHQLKMKICSTGLHSSIYDLAGELCAFSGYSVPEPLKGYVQESKPRILSAEKMFRWLEQNRYKPSKFVHGLMCSPDDRVDFYQGMWPLCGGTDTGGYTWLPEWFEMEEKI